MFKRILTSLPLGLSVATATVAFVACGTSSSNGSPTQNNKESTFDAGASRDAGPPVILNDAGQALIGGGDAGPGSDGGMCAAAEQTALRVPLDLVVLLDRSDSMGDTSEVYPGTDIHYDPALKWIPVTNALNAFFTDPQSAGINASLTFFSNPNTTGADTCDPGNYMQANVPMKALPLPASNQFSQTMAATNQRNDTPTDAALQGGISQMQDAIAADSNPNTKHAIVIATDGVPHGCPTDDTSAAVQLTAVANDAANAFAGSPSIPTYVIGVQGGTDQLSNLTSIAQAGGTNTAFVINTGDGTGNTGAATEAAFEQEMVSIRGSTIACSFQLPAPPQGQSLDLQEVNVTYQQGGSTTQDLIGYNNGCSAANGTGWTYNSTNTEIDLCPATCSLVKTDANPDIRIALGCATQSVVIR